jgi:hypothetical protein
VRLEVLDKFKKFKDLFEIRTRDLPACSVATKSSMLLRAPFRFKGSIYVKFGVFTAVTISSTIVLDVTLCGLVEFHRYFSETSVNFYQTTRRNNPCRQYPSFIKLHDMQKLNMLPNVVVNWLASICESPKFKSRPTDRQY